MDEPRDDRRPGPQAQDLTLLDMPFCRLIEEDEYLAQLREAYADAPPEERRLAAQWEYDASAATSLFNGALSRIAGGDPPSLPEGADVCPGAVRALAIDPGLAPALLTVGSVEYQLGRVGDAMDLFLALAGFPPGTEDLPEIIDKAGDFLLDQGDYGNARAVYAAAAERHPDLAVCHDGLSYCADRLGELDEAVRHARRAVELEPDHHVYLNDLGWCLMRVRQFDEAEPVLEKAAALSPAGDDLARNNLEDLRKLRREAASHDGPNEGA